MLVSVPFVTLALLSSLLIVGCTANEPQSSPPGQMLHRDDISTRTEREKCAMTSARLDSDASACPIVKKRDGISRKMLDYPLEFIRQFRHRNLPTPDLF